MHDLVDSNTKLLIGPEIANFTPYQIRMTQSLVDSARHNVGVSSNLLLYSSLSRSIHLRFPQLFLAASVSCKPLAPSSSPYFHSSPSTTCLKNISHCTRKAFSPVTLSGTFCQPAR
jgi:hypothetical protein